MVMEREEDGTIMWDGRAKIIDEVCECGHLKSHHNGFNNHLDCQECDCVRWTYSDRWVIAHPAGQMRKEKETEKFLSDEEGKILKENSERMKEISSSAIDFIDNEINKIGNLNGKQKYAMSIIIIRILQQALKEAINETGIIWKER